MTLAVALMLLMVALELAFWNTQIFDIEAGHDRADLQRAALDASNYLMRVELISKPNVFEPSKVIDFVSGNYNTTMRDIGVSGFEFYFKLEDTNGSIVRLNGTDIEFGGNYSAAENLAVARRIGVMGINGTSTEVIGYIYLWT